MFRKDKDNETMSPREMEMMNLGSQADEALEAYSKRRFTTSIRVCLPFDLKYDLKNQEEVMMANGMAPRPESNAEKMASFLETLKQKKCL